VGIVAALDQLQIESPFSSLVDEEVLALVHNGDRHAFDYLISKYEGIVRHKARTYFLVGSDREDVIQEGLIGLYKAICDFDKHKLTSFRSFAELCITRQIITSIKSATRLKHTPLNTYISIYKPIHDEQSDRILLDIIDNRFSLDPQKVLLNREKQSYIQARLQKSLTRLEHNVLDLYLQGYSYEEIADKLNRHEKSIDNALQRVKRKVDQLIQKKELVYD